MSRRRRKTGSHDNHERWLITYADLITLLMIFFIVLYAMSKVEEHKFNQLMVSLNSALAPSQRVDGVGVTGFIGRVSDKPPNEVAEENNQDAGEAEQQEKELQDVYDKLQKYIEEQQLSGSIAVVDTPRGIQISIKDIVLFDPAKADLKPESLKILDSLATFFNTVDHYISIEGHTDNVPIHTAKYPSNWELSSARATSVLHYLVDKDSLAPERVRIVGYGEFQPVNDNSTPEERQINRRVDIVILR